LFDVIVIYSVVCPEISARDEMTPLDDTHDAAISVIRFWCIGVVNGGGDVAVYQYYTLLKLKLVTLTLTYSHSPNVLVCSDPHSAGYRSFLVSTFSLDDLMTQPWEMCSKATPSRVVIEVKLPNQLLWYFTLRDTITIELKKGAERYNA